MSFEGSLEVASFHLPDFDGAIFGGGGELGELGMKCHGGDGVFVALHLKFGRGFGDVQVLEGVVGGGLPVAAFGEFLLQALHFFL